MTPSRLIVDGNNLLHVWRNRADLARNFDGARWALARLLDQLAGVIGAEIVLVFDGTVGGRDEGLSRTGIEVLYASTDTSADTVIERQVRDAPRPQDLLVVSSDLGVQRSCSAAGAEVMSCPQFLVWVDDRAKTLHNQVHNQSARKRGPTLGDFFP